MIVEAGHRLSRTGSGIKGQLRDLFLLRLLFVLPSIVGSVVGYYIMGPATGFVAGFDTTYFFALGTGHFDLCDFEIVQSLCSVRVSPARLKILLRWQCP